MNHQSHTNGNNQTSELNSDATPVILRGEEIQTVTRYGEPTERSGIKMRKVTTTKLVPRRTFINGILKGKYWGEFENNNALLKDVGQFYDITVYESEIFIDLKEIRTENSITFSDFLAGISSTNRFGGYQHINSNQLKSNLLVVQHEGTVNRYKIDLHEPRLYNTKIIHALHQSSAQEVFGSIESNICGYLLDQQKVVEESYEIVEDIPNITVPLLHPTDPTPINISEPNGRVGRSDQYSPKQEQYKIDSINRPGSWYNKWLLLPLIIFLLCLLALVSFGNISLWTLPIAALLFFAFHKLGFKLPTWVYAMLLLFLGVTLWNVLKTDSVAILDPITNTIEKNVGSNKGDKIGSGGNSASRSEKTIEKTKVDTSNGPQNNDYPNGGDSKKNQPFLASNADAPKERMKTDNTSDKPKPASQESEITSFNSYIDKGLQAVEDEEYALANQNFKKASKLDPNNPRLRQLADRYSKLANEKCQDFRTANARELMYIPNNYYQYVASLTQTVPLKCD